MRNARASAITATTTRALLLAAALGATPTSTLSPVGSGTGGATRSRWRSTPSGSMPRR